MDIINEAVTRNVGVGCVDRSGNVASALSSTLGAFEFKLFPLSVASVTSNIAIVKYRRSMCVLLTDGI